MAGQRTPKHALPAGIALGSIFIGVGVLAVLLAAYYGLFADIPVIGDYLDVVVVGVLLLLYLNSYRRARVSAKAPAKAPKKVATGEAGRESCSRSEACEGCC